MCMYSMYVRVYIYTYSMTGHICFVGVQLSSFEMFIVLNHEECFNRRVIMGSSSEKGYDSFMPPSVTHALASQKMQNQTCYYSILVKSLYFEDYINQANPHVDVSWLNHHCKSPFLMVESPHYHGSLRSLVLDKPSLCVARTQVTSSMVTEDSAMLVAKITSER